MAKTTTRFGNVTGDLTRSARYVHHLNLTETAGTALVGIEVRDGSAAGTLMATLRAPAGETRSLTFPHPIRCPAGVYIARIGSGTANYQAVTS